MSPLAFTVVFLAALLTSLVLRAWLAWRQLRHVARHRHQVPSDFADRVALSAHQRAADYTAARVRLGLLETASSATVLIAFTLLGGLQWLVEISALLWPEASFFRGLALVVTTLVLGSLPDLGFSWYRQFRLEESFGFNRMTPRLFLADLVKSTIVSALLGIPLLAAVLGLMQAAGPLWWLWVWALWMGFNVLVMLVYPVFIAPWFNRFDPLPQGRARERIETLLGRTGFSASGLYVMDGSRRSAHGNAFFTGFGRARRIVFFDTLLSRLDVDELEAVLAHELGHFKRGHLRKRVLMMAALSLMLLALLGWLAMQSWFFVGLGLMPDADVIAASALVLFILVVPVFLFPLQPLARWLSRRDEFEADAFAVEQASAPALARALVKLYEDNAATLTPDPVHSAFHDSHPPAPQRIARLLGHRAQITA
jgi:STE24 endopeptidase